jgi:hypothetical protein
MCLRDDLLRELLVLPLVAVAKEVLRLAVRLLVVPEPYPDLLQLAWEFPAGTDAA